MRILFVNHSANLSGATISCYKVMTGLGNDHTPIFATNEGGPIMKRLFERRIKTYAFGEKGLLGIKFIRSFMKIIDDDRIGVIHLNTLTPFCKYAAIAGFIKRVPVVWFVRESPLISRSRRLAWWMRLLAKKVVFVDADTRRTLLEGRLADKSLLIHNGVDLEAFRPGGGGDFLFKRFKIEPGTRMIGYIGQITGRKGLQYLIDALPLIKERFENFKLLIIGGHRAEDEEYLAELKQSIKWHGLDGDVVFAGEMTEVAEAMGNLDMVVLPSLEERCSRTLLEAIASGKPAVATRVGGTPEIIEDGFNGLLVEPSNTAQLAEAVLGLLRDDFMREDMGLNGRKRAEEMFDIRENVKRVIEVYREAV